MTTPVLVIDTSSGEVKIFRSKNEFLHSETVADYMARRRDFLIFCGCAEEDRARLYGRIKNGRRELCTLSPKGKPWQHKQECKNWPTAPDTPSTLRNATITRENGPRALFAVQPLTTNTTDGDSGTGTRLRKRRRASSGPNTLAGIVLFMIDATNLNAFDPLELTRDWTAASAKLSDEIDNLLYLEKAKNVPRVVALNRPVRLMDIPAYDQTTDASTMPLRVLAHVTGARQDGSTTYVRVEGFHHEIAIQTARWQYAMRRSTSRHTRRAVTALSGQKPLARVIALFELTRNTFHDVVAHQVGLCTTSPNFIPVESSYELEASLEFESLGIPFIKDIYVPDGYPYRYDFRLFLPDGELIFEVNGMDTVEYRLGKAPAEEHLKLHHAGCHLIWKAYTRKPMPRIPKFIADLRNEAEHVEGP